jgi:hypothetical protein
MEDRGQNSEVGMIKQRARGKEHRAEGMLHGAEIFEFGSGNAEVGRYTRYGLRDTE